MRRRRGLTGRLLAQFAVCVAVLLLLAKMENGQFSREERVDVADVLVGLSPYIESLAGGLRVEKVVGGARPCVNANRPLLENMIATLRSMPCATTNRAGKS